MDAHAHAPSPVCRFCSPCSAVIDGLEASSFESALLFGAGPLAVRLGLEAVEARGVVPCCTHVCRGCRRVSFIVPSASVPGAERGRLLAEICAGVSWGRTFYPEAAAGKKPGPS